MKLKEYDYGNGIKELREITLRKSDKPIDRFKTIDKKTLVNTETGEVKERKTPNNKAEVNSLCRGMLHEFRLLLYNINKVYPDGTVYYITMTNRSIISYEEFNYNLEKYIKKLKYANSQLTGDELKYAFFKEANEKGRYHIHGFIWFDSKEKLHLSEELIYEKWCFGTGKITKLETSQDLINTLWYVSNYTGKNNKKVIRKRKGLQFFPPNTHLVARTKNLEPVPFIEVDDNIFPTIENVISQAKRDQKNIFYQSTFFIVD